MRNAIIILSAFVLIASSCGQATKKQAINENKKDTHFIKLSETHGLLFMRYDNELKLWYEPYIIDFRNNDTLKIEACTYGFDSFVNISPDGKYVFIDNIVKQYEERGDSLRVVCFCALIDIAETKVIAMHSDCSGKWDKNSNWVENGEIRFWNPNNQRLFDIKKIDSVTYFALKEEANIQKTALEKITDLKQAKKLLKGQVIWGKLNEDTYELVKDERGEYVCKIVFRNGKTISYDYPEFRFVAYFPQEDVLFIEGEHAFPVICNLTTGEETNDVGDPDYRHYSPSKRYRFNGYYSGQVDFYFIQEKLGEKYKTIINLDYSSGSKLQKLMGSVPVEYISDVFWQNDTILTFVMEEKFYYQLILK